MLDPILEDRKKSFQRTEKSMLETRENFKLSLRKQKIDEYIAHKREKTVIKVKDRKMYEIEIERLEVDPEICQTTFSTPQEFFAEVKKLLLSSNANHLDHIKLGIYILRTHLANERDIEAKVLKEEGFYEILNVLLKRLISNPTIVYEVLWILSLIACSADENSIKKLYEDESFLIGYIEVFNMYENSSWQIVEQLIDFLGNLVTGNSQASLRLTEATLVNKIIDLLDRLVIDEDIVKACIWFLAHLLKNEKNYLEYQAYIKCCKLLPTFLNIDDEETLRDCLYAISQLTLVDSDEALKIFIHANVCRFIIESQIKTSLPCNLGSSLRILGNILSSDRPDNTDYLISIGCISYLRRFLSSKNIQIKIETLWAFSNIAAGTKEQIKELVTSSAMMDIVNMMVTECFEVAKEIIWVVGNIVSNGDYFTAVELVKIGLIENLILLLRGYKEPTLLSHCLQCLLNLLLQGENKESHDEENEFAFVFQQKGGVEELEALEFASNDTNFQLIGHILEKFFNINVYAGSTTIPDEDLSK